MVPSTSASFGRVSAGLFLGVLLGSIGVFAYTNQAVWLCMPPAMLYLLLLARSWQSAYWVFLAFIPLSVHVQLVSGSLSTTVPDEPVMWLLLLCFGWGVAQKPQSLPLWWREHPLTGVVFLQLIWTVVATLCSQMPLLSFKFLMAKGWFLVSFFVLPVFVFSRARHFSRAFLLLLVPVLVTIVVITVRHAMLDFSFLDTNLAIGRLYYNHVEYAGVLAAVFPLVYVAWRAPGRQPGQKMIYGVLLMLLIPVILLTYARAAIVGIILSFGLAQLVRRRLGQWMFPAFYAVVISALVYFIPDRQYMKLQPNFEQTYMHADFNEHLLATFRGEDLSSMERLYRWIAAMRMSLEHPLVGFGPNTFYYFYQPYALQSFATYTSDNPEHSTTHNYFLYMLAEQGWPGMLLYALLLQATVITGQRAYHRFQVPFYKWCVLGLLMMFAVHFVTNFFSEMIETHKIGALFYINIALILILDHKSKVMAPKPLLLRPNQPLT